MVGDRDSVSYNRALIGNGTWGIKWSRDAKRHVIQRGRGRDTNMLGAHYLKYDWRYALSYDFM